MNPKIKLLLIVLLSVAVILGAVALYNTLSDRYESASMQKAAAASAQASASESMAASGSAAAGASSSLSPAPDFSVYDADGNTVKLSDYLGKPVVVNFWASWCGYCKIEMPDFQKAYETYGDKIQFLMVDLTGGGNDTRAAGDAVIAENGFTFPVFYDDDNSAAYAYGIRSMPTSIFVDADGNLAGQNVGMVSADQLEAYIQQILPK
jgi:cytochrome c biogenesis protein CcmG/thiol:disulfide interchange protein DsbE